MYFEFDKRELKKDKMRGFIHNTNENEICSIFNESLCQEQKRIVSNDNDRT